MTQPDLRIRGALRKRDHACEMCAIGPCLVCGRPLDRFGWQTRLANGALLVECKRATHQRQWQPRCATHYWLGLLRSDLHYGLPVR